jgi:AraC-like DNA-binding protein
MINEQSQQATPQPLPMKGEQQDIFISIDTTIRTERLYVNVGLQRQDICDKFSISRHALNDLLSEYTDGLSFPQYINNIRLEKALSLLRDNPEMTVSAIASEVGFMPANFREQFKRRYGVTPAEFQKLRKKM